ncbi:MAG: TetR/AcrR family transcriptional regulator [Proteobacteria bacterium]|nr:TetR/AcrR family transcriptional regulator [Pseudomonadota bacterium]
MYSRTGAGTLEADSPRDMRQRILDAAARLFAQNGIASTSMREIAKECDILAGSVYYHFKSKDEIITEILNLGIARVTEAVVTALAQVEGDASFRNRLHAAARAHLQAFHVYGDYTATHLRNFKQAPPDVQLACKKARDDYENIWIGILDRGRKDGALLPDIDLGLQRLLLIGSMNWTLEWFHPQGKYTLDELADSVVRMFMDGCAVRAAAR